MPANTTTEGDGSLRLFRADACRRDVTHGMGAVPFVPVIHKMDPQSPARALEEKAGTALHTQFTLNASGKFNEGSSGEGQLIFEHHTSLG